MAGVSKGMHVSIDLHTATTRGLRAASGDQERAMRDDLMARARDGDAVAFRQLIEPHRAELRLHCYRMLGSLQDAEDVLQETLMAAWQGLAGFEGRASFRAWLYRIATHRSLNARRARRRRRVVPFDVPSVTPPEPTGLGEISWLEPFPTAQLEEALAASPAQRYEQLESISLSFLTALQTLPRRSLAVLVLRDVLGFEATEVAEMLDATVDAVNSALKRARAALRERRRQGTEHHHVEADGHMHPEERARQAASNDAVVQRFVRAWEAADVDAVVALLSDDVFISMPPFPNEYEGRDVARRFCASIFDAGRRFVLLPTEANGQPAFGVYLRAEGDLARGAGLYVLSLRGARICAMVRFEHHVLESFGLPPVLALGGR